MSDGGGRYAWEDDAPDADRLAAFIATVHDDLDSAIALRESLLAPFDEPTSRENRDLMDALYGAWLDARETVPDLIDQVLAPENAEPLAQAGLAGSQLAFKVLVWDQARARLLAAFDDSADPDPPPDDVPPTVLPPDLPNPHAPLARKRPRRVKRALKWLSKVLSYADTTLESLTKVLKVADPITEIKNLVEKAAGDTADALPDDTD